MELTKELIEAKYEYKPDTGEFLRKHDVNQYPAGSVAGYIKKSDGYIYIKIGQKAYLAHRIAWLVTHGEMCKYDIDHINGIRNDNIISNLRSVNRSLNLHNSSARARNTSGHKGIVYVPKGKKKWLAKVMINYKHHYLGVFHTIEEAVLARNNFVEANLGVRYRTN